MGLFDKFKNAIGTATDAINKSIESSQSAKDPLSDPIVKQYFEIICGMRSTFLSTGPEAVTGNEKAKKYIEYFLGTACDEAKLVKTLELYNISRTDYPNGKVEMILSDFRKSLTKSTRYQLNKYQAQKMFCQREIDMATAEYNHVIDVIKENPNYIHFSQGISKMQYSNAVKDIVIANSFREGNPITQKLVLDFLVDTIIGRMNNDTYKALNVVWDDVALIVIKALHFEKFGKKQEAYPAVPDEEYRNFVLSVPYYKKAVDDRPFDREECVKQFSNVIKRGNVFYRGFQFKDCHHIACPDTYFCDAVCNLAWKSIAGVCDWERDDENISKSQNAQDVFDIMCAYLNNPDKHDELEIVPIFDDEETGGVEVYDTISDDARSRLEPVDLEDE